MERIIIVHWNKSVGPEPIIQYPPEQAFPSKDLFLKIWAKHELESESSIIEFVPEDEIYKNVRFISILQKYEGEIYFIVLIFSHKDSFETYIKDYPDILAIISKNLIELINTNKITRAISEAFSTIKHYSKQDIEEDLLNFFRDKIKSTILKILQESVISKTELTTILRRDYGFSTINIDLLLISFLREKLIVKKSLPGIGESYFLVKDLSCMRIPPKKLPEQIDQEILEAYKAELAKFYNSYDCVSEVEKKTLISFLLNKDVYSLLKALREKFLSVTECITLLDNKEELFNELIEKKFVYESKGIVYIFSDLRFIKFTPFYLIEKLAKRYQKQELSTDEYLTHLKLLMEQISEKTPFLDYEII